jgi:hypothetical protein
VRVASVPPVRLDRAVGVDRPTGSWEDIDA